MSISWSRSYVDTRFHCTYSHKCRPTYQHIMKYRQHQNRYQATHPVPFSSNYLKKIHSIFLQTRAANASVRAQRVRVAAGPQANARHEGGRTAAAHAGPPEVTRFGATASISATGPRQALKVVFPGIKICLQPHYSSSLCDAKWLWSLSDLPSLMTISTADFQFGVHRSFKPMSSSLQMCSYLWVFLPLIIAVRGARSNFEAFGCVWARPFHGVFVPKPSFQPGSSSCSLLMLPSSPALSLLLCFDG